MTSGTAKASGAKHRPASKRGSRIARDVGTGLVKSVAIEVMSKAKASGLLDEKGSRISGRVSSALVEQAKRRTGITENTQLIEFALASLALEDGFPEIFKSVNGTVDPDIKLGF